MIDKRLQAFVSSITQVSFDKLSKEAGERDFYKFVVARALDKDMRDVTNEERTFVKLALFHHAYSGKQAFITYARRNS